MTHNTAPQSKWRPDETRAKAQDAKALAQAQRRRELKKTLGERKEVREAALDPTAGLQSADERIRAMVSGIMKREAEARRNNRPSLTGWSDTETQTKQ